MRADLKLNFLPGDEGIIAKRRVRRAAGTLGERGAASELQ